MTLDRSIAPLAQPLANRPLPAYEQRLLSNGIPVYLLQYGTVEVAEIQAVFRAGTAHQDRVGISSFAGQMLTEGTASYNSRELAQKLDDYGAWVGSENSYEMVSVGLSTLSRHLGNVLPIFSEVLLQPSFPEEEFVKMKQRQLEKLKVEALKTNFGARRAFGHLLYGAEHPYGMHLGLAELENIQLALLKSYQEENFYPGNMYLTVVGRFDEAVILGELEKLLGNLPMKPGRNQDSLAMKTGSDFVPGRHQVEVEGMQSTVRLGHPGFARTHPDYYRMEVLNTILGGYFGSRLMKNIREEKGYTYGIYSGWASYQYGGYFVVQSDVGNEYVEPTIQEVKKEIKRLQEEPVPEDEMELVKNYLLGQSVSERETPFQLSDILRFSISSDLSFEELDRKFQVIQEMQVSDVMNLAQQYLQPDNMLEVVCGKNPET